MEPENPTLLIIVYPSKVLAWAIHTLGHGRTAEAHAAAAASNRNRTLQAASQRLLRRPKTYSTAAVHSACTTCVLPAVSAPLCSTSSVVEYFNIGTLLNMQ
jgi:hypothetical protein